MIITFSGLDGSGKTTLIQHLEKYCSTNNIHYDSYSIYGELSFYAFFRNLRSMKTNLELKEDINKKKLLYKIFRSRGIKKIFILFDIILLYFVKAYYKIQNKLLIIDRYFYDFIMEITDDIGPYEKFLLILFPAADISFFIDTDPHISFQRKGEYDVATLTKRRLIYDKIFKYHSIDYIINNNNKSNAKYEIIEIIKSVYI